MILLIICACFILTLFATDFVSGEGILTTFKSAEKAQSKTYYGVAIDSYKTVEHAAYTSPETRRLGCAGYLIKKDKYYLIAAVYPTAEDAEKVLSGLNGESACIVNFEAELPSFDWCGGSLKRASADALSYADTAYAALYRLSVQLDTAEKSESEVIAELEVLYNQINAIKRGYEQNLVGDVPFETTKIATEITTALSLIGALRDGGISDYGLVSDLRYVYTLIVHNYCELCSKI